MQTWEDVHSSREWGEWPDDAVIRFIKGQLPRELGHAISGMSVLELGCGAGANLRLFAEESLRIAGIDISASAIAKAQQRIDKWYPDWTPFVSPQHEALIAGTVNELPWGGASFDIIIDCECIYSLDEEAARGAYREAYRVAAQGAHLFVRTFESACYVGVTRQISRNFFEANEGPLAGLPPTRLSDSREIPSLLAPWTIVTIDVISRTLAGGPEQVSELIVHAEKL